MSAPELTEIISIFHQGSDCLTQFFAEQGRSDNDMLMAFDEIDQFLLTAEDLSLQAEQKKFFAARANELLLLIDRLMVLSTQLQHQKSFAFFEQFLYLFTVWFANTGNKITQLIPIVNLIAALSNRLREQKALEELLLHIELIIHAADQSIQEDMDNRDPGRPWRVLLLNYAITATRTYKTDLMEKAFQFLVLNLPDDLKQFFTEGMSQMTALDYPKSVKKVMEKYYWQYAAQERKSN